MAVVGEYHGRVRTLVGKVLSCAEFVPPQPEPDPLGARSLSKCTKFSLRVRIQNLKHERGPKCKGASVHVKSFPKDSEA